MVLDSQLIAEISERNVVKLLAIVRDEGPGDPKLTDDVVSNKAMTQN